MLPPTASAGVCVGPAAMAVRRCMLDQEPLPLRGLPATLRPPSTAQHECQQLVTTHPLSHFQHPLPEEKVPEPWQASQRNWVLLLLHLPLCCHTFNGKKETFKVGGNHHDMSEQNMPTDAEKNPECLVKIVSNCSGRVLTLE